MLWSRRRCLEIPRRQSSECCPSKPHTWHSGFFCWHSCCFGCLINLVTRSHWLKASIFHRDKKSQLELLNKLSVWEGGKRGKASREPWWTTAAAQVSASEELQWQWIRAQRSKSAADISCSFVSNYSFLNSSIQRILTEQLPCARHCSKIRKIRKWTHYASSLPSWHGSASRK